MMKLLRGWIAAGVAGLAFVGGASPAHAQASPSAFTSGTRYDLMNRVTGRILPDPDGAGPLKYAAVRNTYDAAGRLTMVESGELANWKSEAVAPSAWGADFSIFKTVDTVYDGVDRKVKETVTGHGPPVTQTVTQYSYDVVGRLQCTAVRMNPAAYTSLPSSACVLGTEGSDGPDRITRNVYDDAGQLVQLREGVGTSIEAAEATYSYTSNGKKRYVIDGEGNRAELTYDGHDRQAQWVFPSKTRPTAFNGADQTTALATAGSVNTSDYEQYGYDLNGNRTSLTKRDGKLISYGYDALDRMVLKSGTYVTDVAYTYDVEGRQLTAKFLNGDGITSSYNGFGELISSQIVMGTFNKTLTNSYSTPTTTDREGHRLELTHADGQKFTYKRDGLNRLANLYEGTSQVATAQLLAASFDNRGLIDTLQRSTSGNAFATDFTFDGLGRLTSLANEATGTANDLIITQGFNHASQIISQSRSNDAYSWSGAVALTRAYTTNGLNQYTAAGPASFCYDANGNLTADGSSVYLYDIENRLIEKRVQVSPTCPVTDYNGALQASLSYDPMGRLWQVTGATTSTGTRFLYDGDELVAEYDANNILARRYVHSDNVDDPVVQYDGATVGATYRSFLMPDERGSIAGMFYNDGTIRSKNNYDEYGIPGSANQGRFQYTGQAWIPELGMYHYKARIYSPTLGRFLQTDPIGYDDQINLYAYVANDPMNKADPSGNASDPPKNIGGFGSCTGSILCRSPTSAPKSLTGGPLQPPINSGAKAAAPRPNNNSSIEGSTMMGMAAQKVHSIADAGRATGATKTDVAPVRALGRAVTGVGALMKANELSQDGHSTKASIAGGIASEGPAAIIGALIGTAVEPGGGTVALGLVGWGIDEAFGLGDAAGDSVADSIDNPRPASGGLSRVPNCAPMAANGC